MKIELLEYMRSTEIDDTLRYKIAAEEQMIFVRDTICFGLLKTDCFVISTHRSKSIELPVYEINFNGITAIVRENFYGWVVSLKSKNPILLDNELIQKDECDTVHPCYCEGFYKEWCYPTYKDGCTECTFRVSSDYKMWTLFYMLNKPL